jgi:hypothetical protein
VRPGEEAHPVPFIVEPVKIISVGPRRYYPLVPNRNSGGLWGYNKHGPGVQNEIERVITTQKLYVVAPLFKKH